MSQLVAISTSDAALLQCELDRVRPQVLVGGPGEVIGTGAWQDGQVVQRQFAGTVPTGEAWSVGDSSIAVIASRALAVGQSVEAGAQPFRFRQWFFAAAGQVEQPEALRERIVAELPEFLQATVRSRSWEEAAFARFLTELRGLGRIEDVTLDAPTAARQLAQTAKTIEQISGALGVTRRPGVALLASNGRVMVATRRGAQGLFYALLEGRPDCARHELGPASKDAEPLVRDHRRRRSVVVASALKATEGWVELADGATLAIDRRLQVSLL